MSEQRKGAAQAEEQGWEAAGLPAATQALPASLVVVVVVAHPVVPHQQPCPAAGVCDHLRSTGTVAPCCMHSCMQPGPT
jgi:hypothetical protein